MIGFEAMAAASAGLVLVTGGAAAVVANVAIDPPRPAPVTAPAEEPALEAPASVTQPTTARSAVVPVAGDGRAAAAATAEAGSLPGTALAAYQRAAGVLSASDPTCHLEWPLLAAIGRVESDHGRYAGNVLLPSGVSRPGVVGRALDGTGGTALIEDSDAGLLDGDRRYDRAVGAMQFIPSTWRLVAVDADGDGERNPQDIDDSALAAAVHLCYGDADLATHEGRSAAVLRYNRSSTYVDLVLDLMEAYRVGDFAPTVSGLSPQPVLARSSAGDTLAPTRAEEPRTPDRDRPREDEPAPREPRRDEPEEPQPSPTPGPTPGDDEDVRDYVARIEKDARRTLREAAGDGAASLLAPDPGLTAP